jgi:uncharacterized membrane protein
MIRHLIPTGALLLLGSLSASAQTPAGVDFEKQILPIFQERCFDCHQKERTDEKTGKVKKPKGKFRMDNPQLLLKGGEEGGDITPGDAAKSTVYTFTTLSADDDKIMPPKGDPLTKEQQELIKTWINEGAKFGA